MQEWYRVMLMRIIQVMAVCSSKYTRSKVRKSLPKEYSYIIEELLHEWIEDNQNKRRYMMAIVDTIIATGRADHFIATICNVIQAVLIFLFIRKHLGPGTLLGVVTGGPLIDLFETLMRHLFPVVAHHER
jgi:fructose-1,6-bisphosphatase